MAEIGYGIAVKVLELLGSRTFQEISSAWGFKGDLKKIGRRVLAIKAVLIDAEEKQASNERLRTWLRELKDVLVDAENVLDEFQYRVLQKDVMKINGSSRKKVRFFFSGSNPLVFRFKMAHKIKCVREKLDDIAALKKDFDLAERREDEKTTMNRRDMTHSFVNPSNVIGRGYDKEKIMDLLMQLDASRNVSVIPIVGIGGLGKTTLAKLSFDDKRVVSHFQLRMWVCVSEDFEVTRLIKDILKSAIYRIDENFDADRLPNSLKELLKDKKILENLGVDELQCRLRELLKDKKFLLVLDDVWNEDDSKWNQLEELLLGGCNGSKIIVTTRNSSVADIMGTVPMYKLDGLSQEDCLSLLVKLAFKDGREKEYPNLLKIGEAIVEKCKGVPLAVMTLASLLRSKFDEREWKFVRDNEIWNLDKKDGGILPALRLSYNQLPFHLKQCFAYCSLFPKDYEFSSSLLVQFWMAHGILQSPDNEKHKLEDIGDLYIKELMSRSLFQDVYQDAFFTYSFKMHDLVHDLALSIAKRECSVVTKESTLAAEVCHLSISENGQEVTTQLEKLSKVQTIIFQTEQPMSLLEVCISRFKNLRVLVLRKSSFEVLPSSIGSLKHLRYVDLLRNDIIKQLPDSICKLHSLQTLLLGGCSNLERLPKGIRDIISLRFLVVTTKHTCILEKAVGCLESLRTLWIGECENLKCLFEGMEGRLTNLQTLAVGDCPSLTSLSHSIKHLTSLENLMIENCEELSLTDKEENQDLKLSLRLLVIENLPKLEVLPQWLQASANTLQHLKIEDCCNFTALPEWLPRLKSLQTLIIRDCPVFSSLPEGMQDLTALREFQIEDCPKLSKECREEVRHKIAHVPNIDFDEDGGSSSERDDDISLYFP
ncbi:disease resistance protein RGA2-like [Quercus suber]|uniref:disease resistance protein RGA2-like n=1 Tax=Quercus suber TaxID=58331 RepID=UPI000CE2552B|nr:disease resistance protein RGA2-like [Quercus suber]XP_023911770.1 disease resistance protein RGA2-like [Quercus suber]XP_023911771.1 disease resistance protein RGA2-like [Quercus suber]XP_023911772.1 disease resistance protein RGA2-like [Quercus suber]